MMNEFLANVLVSCSYFMFWDLSSQAFVIPTLPKETWGTRSTVSNESSISLNVGNVPISLGTNTSAEVENVAPVSSFYVTPSEAFLHSSFAALSVTVVSEIGDKTFFLAVILAMKHSRLFVFSGALTALILMTALSACIGQVSTVVPRIYVHYVSVALFVLFGLKMLKEGYSMASGDRSEYDEVQKSVQNSESKINGEVHLSDSTMKQAAPLMLMLVFVETFTMTFLAEWGDRSQITTIVLAARENVYGVVFGAIVGHAACTILAVLGGRIVAERISVKAVTLIGGAVFLAFAFWALYVGPDSKATTLSSSVEPTILAKSMDAFLVQSTA